MDVKEVRRIDEEIDRFRVKIKDSETRKVLEDVFDDATLYTLYSLRKHLDALGGSIKQGKEANIFHGLLGEQELAVKIYRISTSSFKAMADYIIGDPRFKSVRHNKKDLVVAWTRKEYRNLKRAHELGVAVPMPLAFRRNVLIMEFIGKNGTPAPQLKDYPLEEDEAENMFNKIIEYARRLYQGELVHADLSEYNILIHQGEPVLIDMGQSVITSHPRATQFLHRDLEKITRFFSKFRIKTTLEEAITRVTTP